MCLSKLWLRTKIFFVKHFYILGLIWWKYWSKLYRAMTDDYSFVKLPSGWDPETAGLVLIALRWSPDGGKELWDVCRSPHWVEFCLRNVEQGYPQPLGALDCDEFAIWAVHVLDVNYAPYLMTISWVGATNEILGHALCVGRLKNGKLFHLGNWGYHAGFGDFRELCEDVVTKARSKELVAWGILDLDLTTKAWGKGLPKGKEYYEVLLGKKM